MSEETAVSQQYSLVPSNPDLPQPVNEGKVTIFVTYFDLLYNQSYSSIAYDAFKGFELEIISARSYSWERKQYFTVLL